MTRCCGSSTTASRRSPSPWLRHREDYVCHSPTNSDQSPVSRAYPVQVIRSDLSTPSLVQPSLATAARSEEHTSELQSLMRISYAVFCLKKKKHIQNQKNTYK